MGKKERKIPVYLSEHDWRSTVACLLAHVEEGPPLIGNTIWTVGARRVRYIADEIVAKLPTVEKAMQGASKKTVAVNPASPEVKGAPAINLATSAD